MSHTELLTEGLKLMGIGMGIVFSFLLLLVLVLRTMSYTILRLAPGPVGDAPAAPQDTNDGALIAVIATAIGRYRHDRGIDRHG